MKRLFHRKWLALAGVAVLAVIICVMGGCFAKGDKGNKVRDLDFTVVAEGDIPSELQQIIAEKRQSPFKLTYSDDQNLYIAVGFGQQAGGGYSIAVNQLYLTENSIVLDTELLGPEKGENTGSESSYPIIVIKTEMSELPVVFQ